MDVDEDSDQFSKTPAPLVETAWVYIGAYKYQLKKGTSHFINQSCRQITNACRRVLGFIACADPEGGQGVQTPAEKSQNYSVF